MANNLACIGTAIVAFLFQGATKISGILLRRAYLISMTVVSAYITARLSLVHEASLLTSKSAKYAGK
ncbi:hypothetical protein BC939DRAFT_450495 [Gamsiella multidivaricata]|uniref:uncharacterized protein n=1 Tax=Gamsiella multidivaricata TaxID=101098 RepID=UPI00221FAD5B|nr:uncharacterized protein BC939DRAFT_450495 [Gamsiella multidivaricata]KAI7824076.1 hypothetical protein BC939DRAFT_450495 [Gamsiella multidivaricata]